MSWDISKLEELVKVHPQAKALVINNPNNPTGRAFDKKELEEIAKILDGRLLISDEVFQPLSLHQTPQSCVHLRISTSLP